MSSTYRFAERFKAAYNDVTVLMREGEKALNDKVSNHIRRDRGVLRVGDCLFSDGHTLNFECLHPETGRPFACRDFIALAVGVVLLLISLTVTIRFGRFYNPFV